jgi:phosphate uptake regulator
METRKVQLSGGTTFTVSLPKPWAEEHGIEAGSVLSLRPNGDGTLLVEATSGRESAELSATLDVAGAGESAVRQRVLSLYAIGCESLTLTDVSGHDQSVRQIVEDTVSGLSGFELLETTEHRIRLTNLVDARNVDIRKISLRMRLVALAMQRDAVSAVTQGDEELAARVVSRDTEADKLFTMVTRHFRRALTDLQETEKLGQGRDTLFEWYYTCRQLERVADHAEKISNFTTDPEAPTPGLFTEEITEVGNRSRRIVDDAADVVLAGGDLDDAQAVVDDCAELVADIETLDRELYRHDACDEAYVTGMILDSLRRTAEYGANIANVGTQQILGREIREG